MEIESFDTVTVVRQSNLRNAGKGLFAKQHIPIGSLFAINIHGTMKPNCVLEKALQEHVYFLDYYIDRHNDQQLVYADGRIYFANELEVAETAYEPCKAFALKDSNAMFMNDGAYHKDITLEEYNCNLSANNIEFIKALRKSSVGYIISGILIIVRKEIHMSSECYVDYGSGYWFET